MKIAISRSIAVMWLALSPVVAAHFADAASTQTGDAEVQSRGLNMPAVTVPTPPPPPQPPSMHQLTVRTTGDGSGAVSVPPANSCPPTCSAQYPQGTPVLLAPVPAPGSSFAGWAGDCQGAGPCTLRIDRPTTVEARFALKVAPSSSPNVPTTVPAGGLAVPLPVPTMPSQSGQIPGAANTAPQVRPLSSAEIAVAQSVFQNTINYNLVKVTNTLGLQDRPWTTNTPPMYTLNVGGLYSGLTQSEAGKALLIHELAHVWQGQHLVPFMLNSAAHQSVSAITNGGDVAPAYSYKVGKPWNQYNVEQQASIVTHWFKNGMQTSDPRYPYVRDHIRANKAF